MTMAYYSERAIRLAACEACKAQVGEPCIGSLGHPIKSTHWKRRRAAAKVVREERKSNP